MVLGGIYFTVTEPGRGWMPLLTGVVLGPLFGYMAYHLLRLTGWAWLTLVLLTVLLLASSIILTFITPDLSRHPLVEIAAEVLLLVYLMRPSVRGAFAPAD